MSHQDNPFLGDAARLFGGANPLSAVSNPFGATAASPPYATVPDVDPGALQGPCSYALVGNGEDVDADEVEVAHVASIEVITVWDSNVLHVDHLTPPRSYFVGEETGDDATHCDFLVPGEMLGARRAPIVVASEASAALVILPGCSGTIDIPGYGRLKLQDLVASGRARRSGEHPGAHEIDLPAGAKARMEIGHSGLAFEVSAVNAGKAVPTGLFAQLETAAYGYFGLSLLVHLGIVASLAFFMPRTAGDDAEAIDRDTIPMIQHLLNAQAEREQEQREAQGGVGAGTNSPSGGTGAASRGESGAMGSLTARELGHKFGVQRRDDSQDPHLAKQAALREAGHFGVLELLQATGGGDPAAPTSPWGRDDSNGEDPTSAQGNLWGDAIGDSPGAGGLGLSGVGEGGGGRCDGCIGLGDVRTIGHGGGLGPDDGFGRGHGHPGGVHKPHALPLREGPTRVNGHIPAEVIQRIVRQNYGRFRLCYEDGLRTNPGLTGRVAVKFVIDRSGEVATAQDGGSDIPDQRVISCVVRGFGNLSFPQPQDGIVAVVYPILFSPGD